MKNRILIPLLCIVILSSCSTIKPPLVGERQLEEYTFFETREFNFGNNDELNNLFNDIYKSSIDQDWDRVVDLLVKGATIVPKDIKQIFIGHLKKMTLPPFPVEKVCTQLIKLEPELESYYRGLIKLHKKKPQIITWKEERSQVDWLDPRFFSLSEMLGYSSKFYPTVEVMINGYPMRMILDTGAELTLIFRDKANKAGINPISIGDQSSLNLRGVNNKRDTADFILIDSMEIGGLKVENSIGITKDRSFGWDNADGLIG